MKAHISHITVLGLILNTLLAIGQSLPLNPLIPNGSSSRPPSHIINPHLVNPRIQGNRPIPQITPQHAQITLTRRQREAQRSLNRARASQLTRTSQYQRNPTRRNRIRMLRSISDVSQRETALQTAQQRLGTFQRNRTIQAAQRVRSIRFGAAAAITTGVITVANIIGIYQNSNQRRNGNRDNRETDNPKYNVGSFIVNRQNIDGISLIGQFIGLSEANGVWDF